jgi:hypothetical protein
MQLELGIDENQITIDPTATDEGDAPTPDPTAVAIGETTAEE